MLGLVVIYFLALSSNFRLGAGDLDVLAQMQKDNGGLPYGQLSDCPGSLKPVIISKKTLKHLSIAVLGPGAPFIAKRVSYNYFQMGQIAKDPRLDFSKKTILFVGGYGDSPNTPIGRVFGKLYKDLNYNVLLLDTLRFTTYEYPLASRNIRQTAMHAAEMLANITSSGLDPRNIELLGLSLGGQTIGFIGKHYYALTGKKLGRLTALDPAGPCFRHLPPEHRLNASDAEFVDVIFTNIDGWGMGKPVGHVNVYVNGGEYQTGEVHPLFCNIWCSHSKVFYLWVAALLNPNKFLALKCDSVQQARNHDCYDRVPLDTNIVGLNVNRSNPGIYYLATDTYYPYYLGERGLKREYQWLNNLKVYNKDDLLIL